MDDEINRDEQIYLDQFAQRCPVTPMTRFLEADILKKVRAGKLEKIHQDVLNKIVKEVQEYFIIVTHQAGVNLKTKSSDNDRFRYKIAPYKYLGRSKNYKNYLQRRKNLEKSWFLYWPLVRVVLNDCMTKLPNTLIPAEFPATGLLSFQELKAKFDKYVDQSSSSLRDFYTHISCLVYNENATTLTLCNLYKICSGLFSVHVSKCIENSLNDILEKTKPENMTPYLLINLYFNERPVIEPTLEDLILLFKNYSLRIIEIGSHFSDFKGKSLRSHRSKNIYLCLTEEFVTRCLESITRNIETSYASILEYVQKLDLQFQPIYEAVSSRRSEQFFDVKFDEGYDKIQFFKSYLSKMYYISYNEYLPIGKLVSNSYITFISDGLKFIIDSIFEKLASSHEYEISDVNATFSLIAYRAKKIPKTTEELMEIGKYLNFVRDNLFNDLTERVYEALAVLVKLITLGVLTKTHLDLNTASIHWIDVIPDLLSSHALNFDQMKFEAEDNLQKIIEEVTDDIKNVYPLVGKLDDMDSVDSCSFYLYSLGSLMIMIGEISKKIQWINQEEVLLSFPKSVFTEYKELEGYVFNFYHLLNLCLTVQRSLTVWKNGQFEFLCYKAINTKLERYEKELTAIQKSYRNDIRRAQEENSVIKFKGTVDDPDILNLPAPLKLCAKCLHELSDFKSFMNITKIMCNPTLKSRHWKEMSQIAGYNLEPNAGTTLGRLIERDYGATVDLYEIISISASKEDELLQKLEAMKMQWSRINFTISVDPVNKSKILVHSEEILEVIDDHLINVLNMRSAVFLKPYENLVTEFHNKLHKISQTVEEYFLVKSSITHFYGLFKEATVAVKMEEGAKLFYETFDTLGCYLDEIEQNPNVMTQAGYGDFLHILQSCKRNLEVVDKNVCRYIDITRKYFPRFYFLSNNEITAILSESEKPRNIEPYLSNLFPSVTKMEVNECVISSIESDEGENINLKISVDTDKAKGCVEIWLKLLEESICTTIKHLITDFFHNEDEISIDSIKTWPGQIYLTVSRIKWTGQVHNSIKRKTIENCYQIDVSYFKILESFRKSFTLINLVKLKLNTLIIDALHRVTVSEELLIKNIQDEDEFPWLAQLRYYLIENECQVHCLYTSIKYGNEYINNSGKLIVTPLTDRCYRTLLSAYHMNLYGSPIGPAGTGKTETVKDLAKTLGILCIVFSCCDSLDFKIIARFLKGIASCGCWLTYDEFNRINVKVMSVISQMILNLQLQIRTQSEVVNIDDDVISLRRTCFICITMNPGYPGRSRLPENLRLLFRNVAMMVPDSLIIAEVSLTVSGYQDSKKLALKLVTAFRFMSERLSIQNYYDFGIRSLKTVLQECDSRSCSSEDQSIVLAILKLYSPMLLHQDKLITDSILEDLFGSIQFKENTEENLEEISSKFLKNIYIEPTTEILQKIKETYHTLHVRHGLIVVGQPFSGKTTILKAIRNIHQSRCSRSSFQVINPKSMTIEQLYGNYDLNKELWTDGVISKYFRDYQSSVNSYNLIIFDGPIDSVWVENLNSFLDDNRKLCLSSGEVIFGSKDLRLIFEVSDLLQASPATVSRCGITFMKENGEFWKSLLSSIIHSCKSEWINDWRGHITHLFEWIIPPLLNFKKSLKQVYKLNAINSVQNSIKLVILYMDDVWQDTSRKEEDHKNLRAWIQASFIQSISWGVGSNLTVDSQHKFDEYLKLIWKNQIVEHTCPSVVEKLEIGLPQETVILDFCYIYKGKGTWKLWSEMIKAEKVEEYPFTYQTMVPTIDTVRYSLLLKLHIRNKIPLLLLGETGTGKTITAQDFLINRLDKGAYQGEFISLRKSDTAKKIQDLIMSKLNKKKLGYYGPPDGKISTIFIDDLNALKVDEYNAQPVFELLRQYLDHNVWYDFKSNTPIRLSDLALIAAATLRENQVLCARFIRHFSVFCINPFSNDVTHKILSSLLGYIWKKNAFPADIISTVKIIISSTLTVYNFLKDTFKPTSKNDLYIFNIYDLNKFINGFSLLKKETADTNKKVFPKLWVHEMLRVFGDRIISKNDKKMFKENVKNAVVNCFEEEFELLFDNLPKSGDDDSCEEIQLDYLLFGVYDELKPNVENLKYEEKSLSILKELCICTLKDYKHNVDLVLFDYLILHVSKICRVLSLKCGNSVLIGLSGSGRKTASILAAQLLQKQIFQPNIDKCDYSKTDWNQDIKTILFHAGAANKQTVFLLDEEDIRRELFLSDLDHLLTSYSLESFFEAEEKQKILETSRLNAQGGNRNIDINASSVFLFFNKCCKANLHVLLCLSSIIYQTGVLHRHQSFLKSCDKIFFENWTENALQCVAETWLKDIELVNETKEKVIAACQYIHRSSSDLCNQFYQQYRLRNYITSTSYMEMIKSYRRIMKLKQTDLLKLKRRYNFGLEKLLFASGQILKMQKSLAEYQPQLEEMTNKAQDMTEQIARETIEVEKASELVRIDEKIANEQSVAAQELKLDCEADLAQAIPILEDAISALNTLKPTDITLVKSMKNPPDAIKLVMAAICVIKDVKPDRMPDPSSGRKIIDYWGPSKRILGDMNFLQTLKEFDKDHIKPEIMVKIRKDYLQHKDFVPHVVAKASSAAEGLCKWIIAIDKYDEVAKEVAPKKGKLEKAEREYAETLAVLNEKKEEVVRIEEKLAKLKALLSEAQKKQEILQKEVDFCNRRLKRAQKLIGGLGGEKQRWSDICTNLQEHYDNLAGDILISCSLVNYLSCFTWEYRQSALQNFVEYMLQQGVPTSEQFDFIQILGSEGKIQNWNMKRLPVNSFFIQNAIIYDYSYRYSLFIDPHYLATRWILKMEEKNHLKIIKPNVPLTINDIENCMSTGTPVLLEGITNYVNPVLNKLLLERKTSEVSHLSVEDMQKEKSKYFRLYITCYQKDMQPEPELTTRLCVINFTLNSDFLKDYLLDSMLEIEKPTLKNEKRRLMIQHEENRLQLKTIEEKILTTLSDSKADILEDENSLKILDDAQKNSNEIRARQQKIICDEKVIEEIKSNYVKVAEHLVVLFASISELCKINIMYQFSLEWFMDIFKRSMLTTQVSSNMLQRSLFLKQQVTLNIYRNVSKGLYVKDRLIFAFLLCTKVQIYEDKISENDVNFLSRIIETHFTNELEGIKTNARALSELNKTFEDFHNSLENDPELYAKLPQLKWFSNLNMFHQLLVLTILKPDTLSITVANYISKELGEDYVSPIRFDIASTYQESYCLSPIIFLLSSVTDPIDTLYSFAELKMVVHKLHIISLGQLQNQRAKLLVRKGLEEGLWICLQNCHLAPEIMSEIEQMIEGMKVSSTNENFRLWLTTHSSKDFPLRLLQKSVKLVNETLDGLKENMLRTYKRQPVSSASFYSGCPGKVEVFTRLLYSVSFFHAVIEERIKFGPIGWNIRYEFKEIDFSIAAKHLQIFVNKYKSPFEALTYIIGECDYGGRVSDDWDQRLFNTLIFDHINKDVAQNRRHIFCQNNHKYTLPVKNEYDDHMKHIMELPDHDSPEVFGLHENVNQMRRIYESKLLFNQINKITSNINICENDPVDTLVSDIMRKLPQEVGPNYENLIEGDPFHVNIKREMTSYHNLLLVMKTTLENIEKFLKGESINNDENELILGFLKDNKIPPQWLRVSYPSIQSLSVFLTDFNYKYHSINTWSRICIGERIFFPALFYPLALLATFQQIFAKENNYHLEDTMIEFLVESHKISSDREYGMKLYGLFLEGAIWNVENNSLDEQVSCMLRCSLPNVILRVLKLEDHSKSGKYEVPVYRTSERKGVISTSGHSSNYIFRMFLPSAKPSVHWIKRGVAIVCQTELSYLHLSR